ADSDPAPEERMPLFRGNRPGPPRRWVWRILSVGSDGARGKRRGPHSVVDRFADFQLDKADGALPKAALAVAQVVLPSTDEGFRIAELAHPVNGAKETLAPPPQRGGVVGGQVFESG